MSKLTLSEGHNPNYIASVVKLKAVRPHSKADRLQLATIYGNTVVVGLEQKEGDLGIYFPVESQISEWFLSEMNLYSDSTMNADPGKKGYFTPSGRVKAIRLREEKSEGIWIGVDSINFDLPAENTDFDTVDGQLLIKKYVVNIKNQQANGEKKAKVRGKVSSKMEDFLVDNQFHLHFETPHLVKNIHKLKPESKIVITQKVHGSSCILSKVLIRRTLKWYEKLAKKLGVKVIESEYGYIWSSGKPKSGLPKGIAGTYKNGNQDFYTTDIWKKAFDDNKESIETGISIYGELVGYTENGGFIQKGYAYGCDPGVQALQVYRITYTSVDGKVLEYTWDQVKAYCEKYGLHTTKTYFEGKVYEYYNGDLKTHWAEGLSAKLQSDYLEKMLPEGLPDEGVCVRIEQGLTIDVFKLKSFNFLLHEGKSLDAGEVSIEDAA